MKEGLRRGDFRLFKVHGDGKFADAFDKASLAGSLGQARCGLVVEEAGMAGRAVSAKAQLQLKSTVLPSVSCSQSPDFEKAAIDTQQMSSERCLLFEKRCAR